MEEDGQPCRMYSTITAIIGCGISIKVEDRTVLGVTH